MKRGKDQKGTPLAKEEESVKKKEEVTGSIGEREVEEWDEDTYSKNDVHIPYSLIVELLMPKALKGDRQTFLQCGPLAT